MGKIKAGSKQSNRVKLSFQPIVGELIAQPEPSNPECPVVMDYWARKHTTGLRKELEQLHINLRRDGVTLDEKLMVQEQKLLNEIDGCFQAAAMLVDKVNDELNVIKKQLNDAPKVIEKPVELQLVKPQETVIVEKTEIKEVMPTYGKVLIAGLVIANILILLLN